jgi:hypothetical protein
LAAVLVLICARTVTHEYKKYIEEKLGLIDGFLSLLTFIKGELSCRLRTTGEWSGEFENAALSDIGFIDEFRKTGSLSSAFCATRAAAPSLGEEVTRLLGGYFESFGKSYKEEEEGEACRVFDELTRLSARERSDSQRSMRTVRVLAYAVALGLIILFL